MDTYDSPSDSPTGIGGFDGRLYSVDEKTKTIYEHNLDTMKVINTYI